MFGLNPQDLEIITDVLKKIPEIKQGIIFGSRALETYKPGSDVDIALFGGNLEHAVSEISAILNERSALPYFFDIVDYHAISNEKLLEHIDRFGKMFYNT